MTGNISIQKPTEGKLVLIVPRDTSDKLHLDLLITLVGRDDADEEEIPFLIWPECWLIAARFLCPAELNKDQIHVCPTIHGCVRPNLPVRLDHVLFPA